MNTEETKMRIEFLESENQRLRDKIDQLEAAIKQYATAIGEEI